MLVCIFKDRVKYSKAVNQKNKLNILLNLLVLNKLEYSGINYYYLTVQLTLLFSTRMTTTCRMPFKQLSFALICPERHRAILQPILFTRVASEHGDLHVFCKQSQYS